MFLKCIGKVGKYYRRVVFGNVKEVLIDASSLPEIIITFNLDAPGCGLVQYGDLLLHGTYLAGNMDRCFGMQRIVISEAVSSISVFVGFKYENRCE